MNDLITVIVPLYNEELVIQEMYSRLTRVMETTGFDYEIVLVNDGSRDRTLSIARNLCEKDGRLKLVSFSRNFGHQIAITAGVDQASGTAVVIIDADLQDPPEVIPDMLKKWKEGYMVVYGARKQRKGESLFKLLSAAMFYRTLRKMTSVNIPIDVGDFRLMDRCVVEQIKRMPERSRFVRGMVSWVGFNQGQVLYTREERFAGETKYPFKKMLKFALDGIFSFSQVPLKLASKLGFLCSGVSLLFMFYGLIVKFFHPETTVQGWTSIFLAIFFLGGIQLIFLGIIGEYLGRIYEETKQRPLYIVDEKINL